MFDPVLRHSLSSVLRVIGDNGAPDTSSSPGNMPDRFNTIEEAAGHYIDSDDDDRNDATNAQGVNDVDSTVEHVGDEFGADDQLQDGDDVDPNELSAEELAALEEGQQEPRAGTFAAHTQQVRLADGTTTTVAQLLNDRQGHGDLAQRESAFQQETEKFTEARGQVMQMYQQMQGHREVLAKIAQALMPQEPDPSLDPQVYNVLRTAYDRTADMIRTIVGQYQEAQQNLGKQSEGDLTAFRETQNKKLLERDKRFGDQKFWSGFWNDAFAIGGRVYGYSAKELKEGMMDHRQFLVLRDALNWQRSQAKLRAQRGNGRKAPNGQPQPQRVINGQGRPGNPQLAQAKAARAAFDKAPSLKNAMLLDI